MFEHKHYFVERQLPSGLWISEEVCSLKKAAEEMAETIKLAIKVETKAHEHCGPDGCRAGMNAQLN